jgi:hypothetical protein
MELLIPGLILVALMVYASTRIKRAAARAYERETIANPDFVLVKPEGMLHRVDSRYAFEAFSREFGNEPAEDVRAATAVVEIREAQTLEAVVRAEKALLATVEAERMFELDGSRAASIAGTAESDGHCFAVKIAAVERGGRTLVLRVRVLRELEGDFSRKTEEILSSFNAV